MGYQLYRQLNICLHFKLYMNSTMKHGIKKDLQLKNFTIKFFV